MFNHAIFNQTPFGPQAPPDVFEMRTPATSVEFDVNATLSAQTLTMYSFTYKGRDVREFGGRLLRYNVSSPELRENEDTIAGRAGVIDYGTELGKREIEVVFDIDPSDEQFKRRQSQILSWLKPDAAGKLVFSDMPDRYFIAKMTGRAAAEQIGKYGEFRITFKCTEPYAYSYVDSSEILLDSDIILDSDFTLDETWTYYVTSPRSVTVNNWGYENIRPKIVISGSWSSVSVGGLTYGVVASGKTLIIDCERETAVIDGVSVVGLLTGDFVELLPDFNEVVIGGTALNCTVRVEFRPKYL